MTLISAVIGHRLPVEQNGFPTLRAALIAAAVLAAPVALSPMLASPAHAQFGFGRIVYDPSNYAQNVLTEARTLE